MLAYNNNNASSAISRNECVFRIELISSFHWKSRGNERLKLVYRKWIHFNLHDLFSYRGYIVCFIIFPPRFEIEMRLVGCCCDYHSYGTWRSRVKRSQIIHLNYEWRGEIGGRSNDTRLVEKQGMLSSKSNIVAGRKDLFFVINCCN